MPSNTDKCTTQINVAKLLKDEHLSVNKTNLANDEDIPCIKLKKFEVAKAADGSQNDNSEAIVEISSDSDNLELIENETNAEDKQEKHCIDDISSKKDKLENFVLNSNYVDQKVTSVEPKSSTNEDLCTVDSNKPFTEFYTNGNHEKVCAQEVVLKLTRLRKFY